MKKMNLKALSANSFVTSNQSSIEELIKGGVAVSSECTIPPVCRITHTGSISAQHATKTV